MPVRVDTADVESLSAEPQDDTTGGNDATSSAGRPAEGDTGLAAQSGTNTHEEATNADMGDDTGCGGDGDTEPGIGNHADTTTEA